MGSFSIWHWLIVLLVTGRTIDAEVKKESSTKA
jgi:hypothetical protein